jgi:hypothetical protein
MKDKIQEYSAVALLVFIIFVLFMFCGCGQAYKVAKCNKWGVCKTVKDSTYIVIKDSTYYIAQPYTIDGDSAYVFAWMECDSARNVVLKQSEIVNGKYIRLQKEIADGVYKVYVRLPGRIDTVYVPATSHSEVSNNTTVQQVKVNELTKWQQFRLGAFPWLLAAIIAVILFFTYKVYKRLRS